MENTKKEVNGSSKATTTQVVNESKPGVDVEQLIIDSAAAAGCTAEQLRIAMVTLAKLKNYFSDDLRAYRLASNHTAALVALIVYVKEHNIKDVSSMRDVIYSVRKEGGKKAVSDDTILKLPNIDIQPRASQKKVLTVLSLSK